MHKNLLQGSFAYFLLISLCLFARPLSTSIETAMADTSIPPVPKARADRFGIYNWGVDYEAHRESDGDRLNWAADKVASLGSRTIRITMPGIFYNVGPSGKPTLAQTAASDAYDRLFSDPRFRTYLITAYSWEDMRGQWADGYSEEEYNATRNEVAQLGDYLLSNPRYAGKTFIILNWEGDNAIYWYSNKQTSWDSYTAWI
ncbi:MAG TPA: hypothetical protein VEF04_12035, partial [Blastocatellia bacterium]|nr:hypothetical protein [Blastocatellia bacterium]